METVNVLTSYVTAKQQQVMYNTSRTDMTAANNTRENISNYLQTNVINNMQHTVNMARL
jgi:predicted house-cleaning NTP pyrophosphatase (Maf/HAM1 superfamily)